MEKKKYVQSVYGKLFNLPYIQQSDIVMSDKFLNISTVFQDKSGSVVLDPFNQATNINNKILDVVAEPKSITKHTVAMVLYIAYKFDYKLSSNLQQYLLVWAKTFQFNSVGVRFDADQLIPLLDEPFTFLKMLQRYNLLKFYYPLLKKGISKIDVTSGNRVMADTIPKHRTRRYHQYLGYLYARLGEQKHTKHARFVRIIKAVSDGASVTDLFIKYGIGNFSEQLISELSDVLCSLRLCGDDFYDRITRVQDKIAQRINTDHNSALHNMKSVLFVVNDIRPIRNS